MQKHRKILENFGIRHRDISVSHITNGNINDTFRIRAQSDHCDGEEDYLLQRINHKVFRHPDKVMDNIINVTEFMRSKLIQEGGDGITNTLIFLKTRAGKYLHTCAEGCYWRVCNYINDASTYDLVNEPAHFYSAGRAYGQFLKILSDYPVDTLHETIVDFHNTPLRVESFRRAVHEDPLGRAGGVKKAIEFLSERSDLAGGIVEMLDSGAIPLRVTHNDTKLNNILIDDSTGEGVCVIDLDTVMPGSCLYDFGDAVRSGANPGGEEAPDLDSVYLDLSLFELYTKGYLEEAGDTLCHEELENLAYSAKLIAFELALRFLTDYINGDIYFKTREEHQNCRRAEIQIKLLADMETKFGKMQQIVQECK